MVIHETSKYKQSYKKIIIRKHMIEEQKVIEKISSLFNRYDNLKKLMISPYKNIYHIEQKKANLKEYYTARINNKMRLIMKPVGEYPYNEIEIEEIEFIDIDNKHYGEG